MESNERTPLITVVHIAPQRRRRDYTHSRVRQCCSTILAIALLMSLTAFIILAFVIPDCEDSHRKGHRGRKSLCIPHHPFYRNDNLQSRLFGTKAASNSGLNYTELLSILSATPEEDKAREWSKYYTSGPHLAGKNLSMAEWTRDRWVEWGIKQTEIVPYDVYINYPLGHRLALLEKDNATKKKGKAESWTVKYEASLEEDVLEDDPTTGREDRIMTFHGYSATGNVTGQYVYVNYGTYYDFEDLVAANISLKGKIALAKYGGIFRGLKVKRAEELGMIGCVIYSDPGDDGDVTEDNGNKTYPDGPARNPSSVQRGSVQDIALLPGDPTTPGVPSKPGVPRQNPNTTIPGIPSLPISYEDALPLLKALNGHGPRAKSFNKYWQGGGLKKLGVDYNIGPSPPNLHLNLANEQEYVITPLWNVIGIINGSIPDEVVVLGNHRDAWILGGAGDPNSGSAAMNEVIRGFGAALAAGWKPLRTIVLASWDGEEYGLVGSTEWVEEYLPWLNETAVAYLNVDVGTTGPNFKAAAAPLLNQALIETTKLVLSPNQTTVGATVYDIWDKHISTMGSGSDFTAFQDFAGIPCVDMGFSVGKSTPVYHYHSKYDSFYWMDNFGDPGWHYHVTMARVWALLAARIVETPIIELNATDYAIGLKRYLESVEDKAWNATSTGKLVNEQGLPFNISFKSLEFILDRFHNSSIALDAEAETILDTITNNPIPWWRWWERLQFAKKVKSVNDKYKTLERHFLYSKGLDGRPWFKHVVFAPGRWTGYAGATFPGLIEAVEDGDLGGVFKWMSIISGVVAKASYAIEPPKS
jgi:N-acetylated-alpha-linked acidic dipeptidase